MSGLMGVVVAVIVGVIGLAIIVNVISALNITGLTAVVVGFIPVLFAVGLMIASVSWAQ